MEITLGDSSDALTNIESVKDPVDGDIKQNIDHTITKDGYYLSGDTIVSEAGEYTITVIAFDKNGNKAKKSYKVTMIEKPQESSTEYSSQPTPAQPQGSY